MFFLCIKKNNNFYSFQYALLFLTRLLLSTLYKQLSSSFQLPAVLDYVFDYFQQFVKKIDKFSSSFRCSYDIKWTVYYSFPAHRNLSQIHSPIHTNIPTSRYLRLKRFLAHRFPKSSELC